MSLSKLLTGDDPRLRVVCASVEPGDISLEQELASLHQALDEFRSQYGFGRAIAAPQLGIMKRMIAFNLDGRAFDMVNPQIEWRSDETQSLWDDCLSLPDILVHVSRHASVSLTYQNANHEPLRWDSLPPEHAELVQHEIDHLDGILMTDRAINDQSVRPMSERAQLVTSKP